MEWYRVSNLNELKTTQVFMTSHSTHIASDCDCKNLNILFKDKQEKVKSFSGYFILPAIVSNVLSMEAGPEIL